ncbi:MAG: flagellin [Sphingobium sp.]|nr:flagellin [Sphingobium sp.]MCP5400727.1 flagellin [Sphingomonas sp.]
MVAITSQTMRAEIQRMQRLSQSISEDQAAVSSGKKIRIASQDPQTWVQISEIGRAQVQNEAWTQNIGYGVARANKAEANLNEINGLFSRARELMINASTSTLDAAGQAAIVAELQSIRAAASDLLNENDYQGVPVFDDNVSTQVPVSRNLTLEVVGTRQSISENIDVDGTPRTLDDILLEAINAVTSNVQTDRDNSLRSLEVGLDHVILQQSVQGIRGDRLEDVQNRVTDTQLDLSERRSELEDTDLNVVIARIQSKLLSLEAAQATLARINRQSLFDLIR